MQYRTDPVTQTGKKWLRIRKVSSWPDLRMGKIGSSFFLLHFWTQNDSIRTKKQKKYFLTFLKFTFPKNGAESTTREPDFCRTCGLLQMFANTFQVKGQTWFECGPIWVRIKSVLGLGPISIWSRTQIVFGLGPKSDLLDVKLAGETFLVQYFCLSSSDLFYFCSC